MAAAENKQKCKLRCFPTLVPWIPVKTKYTVEKDDELFPPPEMGTGASDAKSDKIGVTEVLGTFMRAFPFYLPGRFHQMDGLELHLHSRHRRGAYWISAGHFTSIASDHATTPYHDLKHGVESQIEQKACLDLCETAAEFLLEPWVVLQLPLQPALLHQWAVGALAETLRFCERLVQIGTRGYAPRLHRLYAALAQLSRTLYKNCHALLSHFFALYCEFPDQRAVAKSKTIFAEFPSLLAETLAALEFVLGDECTQLLDAIKRKSWCKENSPGSLRYSPDSSEIGCFDFRLEPLVNVYSTTFWIHEVEDVNMLCTNLKNITHSKAQQLADEAEKYFAQNCPKLLDDQETYEQYVKKFVKNNILHSGGAIEGLDADAFVDGLENNLEQEEQVKLKQGLLIFLTNNELGRALPPLSVLSQIWSLQDNVSAAYALGTMTRLVWLAAERFNGGVHLDRGGATLQPAEFSVKDFKARIKRLEKQWTTEAIFEKARATCVPLKENHGEHVLLIKLVQDYTGSIRRLVLHMHELHYAALKDPDLDAVYPYYPECLYVQYVLPCFVAMLIDVCKDGAIDTEDSELYENFLHILIEGYTADKYIQLRQAFEKKEFYFPFSGNDPETKMRNVAKMLGSLPNSVVSSGMQRVIVGFTHLFCGQPKPNHHTESQLQIWRLCSRVDYAMSLAGWLKEGMWATPSKIDVLTTLEYLSEYFSLKEVEFLLELRLSQERGERLCRKKFKSRKFHCMQKEASSLTAHQLDAILFFTAMNSKVDKLALFSEYQQPIFRLDPINFIAAVFVGKNAWNLQVILSKLTRGPGGDELTSVPLGLAKKNICCRPLLKAIANGKVKMDEPGQITFLPIRHCRWCGLVDAKFLLCPECKDDPDFHHHNYFCSLKCKKSALDKCHLEEHARFTMFDVGMAYYEDMTTLKEFA